MYVNMCLPCIRSIHFALSTLRKHGGYYERCKRFHSLRKFKKDEDDILELLSAGIAREISIHVQSTESNAFVTLSPSQIQAIIAKHPEKENVHMGMIYGNTLFSKHRELIKQPLSINEFF